MYGRRVTGRVDQDDSTVVYESTQRKKGGIRRFFQGKSKVRLGIFAALIIFLLWFTAPMLRWLWFDVLLLNLPLIITGVLGFLLWAVIATALGTGRWRVFFSLLVGAAMVAGFLLWTPFQAQIHYAKLANEIESTMKQANVVPPVKGVRYQNRDVAQAIAESSGTGSPTLQFGDFDPILNPETGDTEWVAPRIPSTVVNRWFGKADGIVTVKNDGSSPVITQQPMSSGEAMQLTDNIYWDMYRTCYLCTPTDPYYYQIDGQVMAVVPYVNYYFDFPVLVPTWGGVFLVHPDGNIEKLQREQALTDQRLQNVRLYPEWLAKKRAEAWPYKKGVWNEWWLHVEQSEIPTISGSDNQMPYHMSTQEGGKWFVAFEPFGPSYNLYEAMLFDDRTGDVTFVKPKAPIMSPNDALKYVQTAFPNEGWYRCEGSDNCTGFMIATEPLPITRPDGSFYWKIAQTNRSYKGINKTILVNGAALDGSDVRYINNVDELRRFSAGSFEGYRSNNQQVTPPTQQPNAPPTAPADQPATGSPEMTDQQIIDRLDQLNREQQQLLEELRRRNQGR